MQQVIEVKTADFAVAKGDYTLESRGIGSCLVLCLYDGSQKLGALCHIMLPQHPAGTTLNLLRFADTAIPMALEELKRMGSNPGQLVAHLIGGASMFQGLGDFVNQVGNQNVVAVQQILKAEGIPVISLEVGGNRGRNVAFFLDSGAINVTSKV